MSVQNLLSQKKPAILKRWFQLIMKTYPADTSVFLKQEKNRFTNPVGHTISQEIATLYEGLLEDASIDRLSASLENILKIRSIQNFSPGEAANFVFLLKKAVREELTGKTINGQDIDDLLQLINTVLLQI